MKKSYVVLGVVILMAVFLFLRNSHPVAEQEVLPSTKDFKNISYLVDGENITLANGVSEISIADSSAKLTTRYFGNELYKDINGDDREDVVFLLTQETGGSGTFFYVVAALNTVDGYVGAQALFLGDRIAPQTTESGPGRQIIVNYADRNYGESFDVAPSVGKSLYLLFDVEYNQFGEVVQNFEGESAYQLGTDLQVR